MNLDQAAEQLQSKGLYVERHVPGASDGLTIARRRLNRGELSHLVDPCFVFRLEGAWAYRNWSGIGGRAPDDVQFERLALPDAICYAEDFYFGDPLVIDSWSFPVNKHPEWRVEVIRRSYEAARVLAKSEWRDLRSELHCASEGLDESERFLKEFREIEPTTPTQDLQLWIRNDLAEMFLVRQA